MSLEQLAARAAADLRDGVEVSAEESLAGLTRTHRRRRTAFRAGAGVLALVVAAGVLLGTQQADRAVPPADGSVRNGALLGMSGGTIFALEGDTPAMPEDAGPFTWMQFTRDGSALVYSDQRGRVVSRDVRTREWRVLARCPMRDYCPAVLSPDGHTVAMPSRAGTVWADTRTGGRRPYPFEPDGEMTWSPDGTRLAVLTPGALWVVDTADGTSRRIESFPRQRRFPSLARWSPDGERIAFVAERRLKGGTSVAPRIGFTVITVRPDGSDRTEVADAGSCTCWTQDSPPDLAWSPDGTRLAVTAPGRGTLSFRPDGTDLVLIGHTVSHLAWQPLFR